MALSVALPSTVPVWREPLPVWGQKMAPRPAPQLNDPVRYCSSHGSLLEGGSCLRPDQLGGCMRCKEIASDKFKNDLVKIISKFNADTSVRTPSLRASIISLIEARKKVLQAIETYAGRTVPADVAKFADKTSELQWNLLLYLGLRPPL